jgi:protein tyrosine phosphatase (PTP) superfamily phosphohydrolase (DUF442 family)
MREEAGMALTNAERLTVSTVGPTNTLAISTRVAGEALWPLPSGETSAPSLTERLMGLFYRLCTPTLELPMLLNFGEVTSTLCRGAQPSRAGFQLLKGLGVDTVINLRVEAPEEEARVRDLGMHYFYFPMDPIGAPTHEQTLAFLRVVTNPRYGKVFFHCYHGADRTGLMGACYRVAVEGWTLTEALAEMEAHKFHRVFQAAKLEYLLAFDAYWRSLGADQRSLALPRA